MKHSSSSQNKFPFLESSGDALYIKIRVFPKSGRNTLSLSDSKEVLKVRLTSAPVEGAANKALIALLAKSFKIKKNSIEITSGKKSRNKRVKIEGVEVGEIETLLNKIIEE